MSTMETDHQSAVIPSTTAKRASSKKEFAKRWGVHPATVDRLAARGQLRITKILGKSMILSEDEDEFAARLKGDRR